MALASYPGFFMTSPPVGESQIGVYWPTLVPSAAVEQRLVIGESSIPIPHVDPPATFAKPPVPDVPLPAAPSGPTRELPLGTICGAIVAEKFGAKQTDRAALKAGMGAATGFVISTIARLACAVVMIVLYLLAALSDGAA